MNLLKNLFKYFVGLLVIFLAYIIRPFIKLKFGILYAERIGHLALSFDNYIYARNKRQNIELAFFYINSTISNIELLRLWKKERMIFFIYLFFLFFISSLISDAFS